jgi:hypothetical protein
MTGSGVESWQVEEIYPVNILDRDSRKITNALYYTDEVYDVYGD